MSSAASDPLIDRVLGGKYTLVERLGAGGFGAVYRAIQAPVGRVVAVKVIGSITKARPSSAPASRSKRGRSRGCRRTPMRRRS